MPIVYPQIFTLPPEDYSGVQQGFEGGGKLLAALVNLYRQRGGGSYTSPTGATAQISPAEAQLSQQLAARAAQGQGSFTPQRLSFLGPVPINPNVLPRLQVQQAQADIEAARMKQELFPLEKKKLTAETLLTESQAEFFKKFGADGTTGENGIPGIVVSVDETGQKVAPETPGARQLLIQPTKSGPKLTLLPQPTPERVQAQSAIDSMLESIDTMEDMVLEDPSRLIRSNIPFMEREFRAVVDQFDKEAAIAAGGKQLTQTELNLIRRTRPTIQDFNDPAAIHRKFAKLRQIGRNAKARLAGVTPKSERTGSVAEGQENQEPDPLNLR